MAGITQNKQQTSLIFIVVPKIEQVPKVQKQRKKKGKAKRDVYIDEYKRCIYIYILKYLYKAVLEEDRRSYHR